MMQFYAVITNSQLTGIQSRWRYGNHNWQML